MQLKQTTNYLNVLKTQLYIFLDCCYYYFICIMPVCGFGHICAVVHHVNLKGQIGRLGSLLPPLCEFWELNSGYWTCTASIYLLNHFIGSVFLDVTY